MYLVKSYAQNFEDVILQRVFSQIPRGFYVDVGANSPTQDSVTLALYEKGWTGINIEPVSEYFQLLQEERPRDINLQVFVSDAIGSQKITVVHGSGLSTGADVEPIYFQDRYGFETEVNLVDTTTLSEILSEYGPESIHLLKIDVEGFEEKVISGIDLQKFRPWVVVVEATIPGTSVLSEGWGGSILEAAGYEKAYFDGVNFFYLAVEHKYLLEKFSFPPNVFDGFYFPLGSSAVYVREHEARIQELISKIEDLETIKLDLEKELERQSNKRVRDRIRTDYGPRKLAVQILARSELALRTSLILRQKSPFLHAKILQVLAIPSASARLVEDEKRTQLSVETRKILTLIEGRSEG